MIEPELEELHPTTERLYAVIESSPLAIMEVDLADVADGKHSVVVVCRGRVVAFGVVAPDVG